MKAYILHGVDDLRYEDIEIPEIPNGWVLVEVKAAGICGSDIPRIFETGTYHFPTIPGHEFSGKVKEIAENGNRELIGKRVGVFPLIPCGKCDCCKNEQYEMCSNYNYLGSRTDGGFGEYVIVPEWNIIEIPDNVSYEEAAMLEPMSVGIHALRQIDTEKISSVVIYGLGPIGLMMAQWCRIQGIDDIYLVGNKEAQIEVAQKLGFKNMCNSSEENPVEWILKLTNGRGVELAIEGVGSNKVFAQTLESVCPKGSLIILGNPKGDLQLEKQVFWKIHRKQLCLFGSWNSSYTGKQDDDWHMSIEALRNGKMDVKSLITHKLEWNKLIEGLNIMKNKTEYYCKVMIVRE